MKPEESIIRKRFYMFSIENGVEVMDLDVDMEEYFTHVDECPFIMTPVIGNVYEFASDDFTNGPDVYLGSEDPYELRSHIMRLFVVL